jgi:hypothetical protein
MKDIDLEVNYVDSVDFQYNVYQEDVVIIGKKREGKTDRAKKILESIQDVPYWIWDFGNVFTGYGHVVHSIDDLQYGQYVVQERDKSETRFRQFCQKIIDGAMNGELTNLVIVIDEIHQYVRKQSILQELYNIVMSLRNFGICGIYISTRPQAIPNWILENVTHVFAYRLELSGSIIWLRDYLGMEAWLLLPKDKRKFLFSEKYKDLPQHSFIYRNQNESKPQVKIASA